MKDIEGIDRAHRILEPYWQQIQEDFNEQNRRFLALAAANHDAIGRVLRGHLVIESFMDSYLATHYAFENIDEVRLSFFQKAKLLPSKGASAAAIRPGVLEINAIRNRLGHRLQHNIEFCEIHSVLELLSVARRNLQFLNPVEAIEAFVPVACAFLSVPPPHLQKLFHEAFAEVRSYVQETPS